MLRCSPILLRSLLLLASSVCSVRALASENFSFHHENVMGTALELQVNADTEHSARWAEAKVLSEIDRLSAIFNGYDRSSEFSRWQQTLNVETAVSPELFEVLQRSEYWMAKGSGSFDPRVQALTDLWSRCARADRLPTPSEHAEVRAAMAERPWRLDLGTRTATHRSRCALSLNGIAKGFIVDQAVKSAWDASQGIRGILLNVGGDLRVSGDIQAPIGIASPKSDSETTEPISRIEVKDRGVATSGNYQRGFKIRNRWYSHIFDPRAGQPVDRVISATVIANKLADADAMAKIFSVLSVEESLQLVKSLPGVECLLVSDRGSVARSDGFRRYEAPRFLTVGYRDEKAAPPATEESPDKDKDKDKASAKSSWGEEFELVIDFEINSPQKTKSRYRRPYVAIWVEDKDGLTVRTLTLWVQKNSPGPRWIPDLKHWYQSDQVRRLVDKTDLVEAISRATRPAGKYKIIWDGKDEQGKLLPVGSYTILIEVAREHGTHQIIRKPLTLADRPLTEELKGNVEIKSASIEIRRKGTAQ